MKTTGVIVIALAMLIALNGVVMADEGVPAVPGAGGITSSTVISSEGMVMESQSLAWSIAGGDKLASRALDPNQTQYSTTYDASTVAQGGKSTYVKTLAIDTGNKLITQSNIKADTAVTFVATGDGGNILGSENIMIDGASMRTTSLNRMICPFGSDSKVFPAYCNIVTAGSKYDLNVGSVVTSASDRFVDTDATAPVVLKYAINVKPYTIQGQRTSPAMGSVSAYVNVHIQEARGSDKSEDLTDTESSSASGVIRSFSKTIAYQSGKRLLP